MKRVSAEVDLGVSNSEELTAAIASAFLEVRENLRRDTLKQSIQGVLKFKEFHSVFPFDYPADDSPRGERHADMSWRAVISTSVKAAFVPAFNQSPSSPENAVFLRHMPRAFGVGGIHTTICWVKSDIKTTADIADGSSNTICLIENPAQKTPWLKNNDNLPGGSRHFG